MLCGVAFFSFVLGNFIEIIANYDKKMGSYDKMPDLNIWLVSLERFNNDKPLKMKLVDDITKNHQYFWIHDRKDFLEQDVQFAVLPQKIVNTIMSNYLYSDIFNKYTRFFNKDIMSDSKFLCKFAFGLIPRRFDSSDPLDKIIYEENQEVGEMYFVQEGKIGIGINAFS